MPWKDRYKLQSPIKILPKKGDQENRRGAVHSKKSKSGTSKTKVSTRDQESVWVCEECQHGYASEDDKVVSCSQCRKYFCLECIEMTDSEYETLARPDVFWLCPVCVPKTRDLWDNDSHFEEKCDVMMEEMQKKMNTIEQKLEEKLDNHMIMEEMQKKMNTIEQKLEEKLDNHAKSLAQDLPAQISTLETKLDNQFKSLSNEMPHSMSKTWTSLFNNDNKTETQPSFRAIMKETLVEQKKEEADRENRENNIIIYNVDESEKVNAGDHTEDNMTFFKTLCEEVLQIQIPNTKKNIRLGKKPAEGEPQCPRPLKVILDSKDDRNEVIKHLTKLKDAEEKFRQISVTHDYCKEDREKIRTKVAEAKQLEEVDQSKNFRYRVRGPLWDLRIIKIVKSPETGEH